MGTEGSEQARYITQLLLMLMLSFFLVGGGSKSMLLVCLFVRV